MDEINQPDAATSETAIPPAPKLEDDPEVKLSERKVRKLAKDLTKGVPTAKLAKRYPELSENDLRTLKKLSGLTPELFGQEMRKHTQGLLGKVTALLYAKLHEMSAKDLMIFWGILRDKDAAAAPVSHVTHQTNIQINGASREMMVAALGGKRQSLRVNEASDPKYLRSVTQDKNTSDVLSPADTKDKH